MELAYTALWLAKARGRKQALLACKKEAKNF
jgi:hypothetical protein